MIVKRIDCTRKAANEKDFVRSDSRLCKVSSK